MDPSCQSLGNYFCAKTCAKVNKHLDVCTSQLNRAFSVSRGTGAKLGEISSRASLRYNRHNLLTFIYYNLMAYVYKKKEQKKERRKKKSHKDNLRDSI